MAEPSLLLLIPAYNEEARIEPVLREFGHYFQNHYPGNFQLVVVLNGCRDNTRGVVERVAKEFSSISLLDFPDPIGKGGALIEGLKLASKAEVIGYVDADGASLPEAFHALVKRLSEADCIIGLRWLPGAVLHQAQPWLRRFSRRCFHNSLLDAHPRYAMPVQSDASRRLSRSAPPFDTHRTLSYPFRCPRAPSSPFTRL